MGRNKLKDVFSMEPPQPEIEVVFRDAEAQKEFEEAMYLAWENGTPENVKGIKRGYRLRFQLQSKDAVSFFG